MQTDGRGEAFLEVLSGDFQISAERAGFLPATTPVVSGTESRPGVADIYLVPLDEGRGGPVKVVKE